MIEHTGKLERFGRIVLRSVVCGLVLMILLAVWLYCSIASTAPEPLPLTADLAGILTREPHRFFYAARRFQELPSDHVLHKVPRYLAISVLNCYFQLTPADYAQTVAWHVPFRSRRGYSHCEAGLARASATLFGCPMSSIPAEDLERLLRYSASPLRYPLANSLEPSLSAEELQAIRLNDLPNEASGL